METVWKRARVTKGLKTPRTSPGLYQCKRALVLQHTLLERWVKISMQTSQRQQRQLPPCPLVIALVPLKRLQNCLYNFLIGCPLPKRECLGALALSNKAYMTANGWLEEGNIILPSHCCLPTNTLPSHTSHTCLEQASSDGVGPSYIRGGMGDS